LAAPRPERLSRFAPAFRSDVDDGRDLVWLSIGTGSRAEDFREPRPLEALSPWDGPESRASSASRISSIDRAGGGGLIATGFAGGTTEARDDTISGFVAGAFFAVVGTAVV
jgi:hypothetical protein